MRLGTRIRRALDHILRVVRSKSDVPNAVPESEHWASLLDLPPELLHYILGYIGEEWKSVTLPAVSRLASPLPKATYSALREFSSVNRHLRALCRPVLFRLVEIDPSGPLPPSSILPYVQSMTINNPFTSEFWVLDEEFILGMRQLERVYWHGEGMLKQAPLSRLRLLLSSPSLHTLTLSNVWLLEDGADWNTACGLRSLRVDFSHQVQNRSLTKPEFVEAHLACFHSVLDILRPRLESLTVSGYSARLSSLATAPWPSLREFSLTRGDAILDVPWATLLGQMPVLQSFIVALDRGETPTAIFPTDAASVHAALLTNIRHFTISFPDPDDPVFATLPPDLQELSLRDTPRYYTNRRRWRDTSDIEPILSCPDVLRIFSALSAKKLCALELVYLEDQEEFEMLGLLSQSCPRLTLLELHRYPARPSLPDAWYKGTLSIPMEAIADALAAFQSLRALKLNLRFTDYDVTRFIGTLPEDYWERLDEFLEAQAYTIAARVPWIGLLSFLTWSTCGMHWDTWSVHAADSANVPQLVHEVIYHDSFYGCHEPPSF